MPYYKEDLYNCTCDICGGSLPGDYIVSPDGSLCWDCAEELGGGVVREIKFRAWDKELKIMVYSKELTGHIEYDTNPVDALNTILNEDDYGLEFMQYTGLRDSKRTEEYPEGQRIFEGDILKISTFSGVLIAVVEYENASYRTNVLSIYDGKVPLSYLLANGVSIEVIGNIHDNPDLLTEK